MPAVAHTPQQQVYTTLHTGTKRHCERQWSFLSSAHLQVELPTRCPLSDRVCLCVRVPRFLSQSSTTCWSASACFHCSSPVHQPPSQAEETTAAVASASNSHLPSPLNHFPIHCLQTHITQHPHRLLISEPTLREWTWPRKTGVCKQHHLTRQSLC